MLLLLFVVVVVVSVILCYGNTVLGVLGWEGRVVGTASYFIISCLHSSVNSVTE